MACFKIYSSILLIFLELFMELDSTDIEFMLYLCGTFSEKLFLT